MPTPIKWVKFFTTGSPTYVTLFTEGYVLQNDGETTEFTTAEQAVAESTVEVYVFWDNEPIGIGALSA